MDFTNSAPLLIRLLGLFFIIEGAAEGFSSVVYSIMIALDEVAYVGVGTLASPVSRLVYAGVLLVVGLYLFASPNAIAAHLTPDEPA
jgi:hypothetical protein